MSTEFSNDFPTANEAVRRAAKKNMEPQLSPQTCQILKEVIENAANKGRKGIEMRVEEENVCCVKKNGEWVSLDDNGEDLLKVLELKGYIVESGFPASSYYIFWSY